MKNNFVKVICIKGGKGIFVGEKGEEYLINLNSVREISGEKYVYVYSLNKELLGFWKMNRFTQFCKKSFC